MEAAGLVAGQATAPPWYRATRVRNRVGRGEQRRLRVLFVNDHLVYPGGVIHGVTRYVLDVLPRLSTHVAVGACFFRSPGALPELEEAGVQLFARPRPRWDPRSLLDLAGVVREFDPDILHLAGLKGMSLGRIVARVGRRSSVVHFHDLDVPGPAARLTMRALAGLTDAAVAVSAAAAGSAVSMFGIERSRMQVIPNGVVLDRFKRPGPARLREIRASLALDRGSRVVGVVGRLAPGKGQVRLIRSLPLVLARVPKTVLVIVGDGVTRAECEAEAASLGVARAVRFVGQRRDVPELLHAFDVVAVPSEREGFSLAALEAMAAGRPVVACRVGGLADLVVHGESGILVEPTSVEALAEGIATVLESPALARGLGALALERARAFALDSHVGALLELYFSLVPNVGVATRTDTPRPLAPSSSRSGGS
ncbi:MAG TPA: glycosyltransferase family 4 protein [Longimicrobiales bacterium]|nr:glycosyltransferase family 4 protein [Longimicrobiales bacterium]